MTYPTKMRLTDAATIKFPFVSSGQKLIADEVQPGLFLKIGKTAKSWVVQREVRAIGDDLKPKRKTVRKAFGSFPDLSVKDAREIAVGELLSILERQGVAKEARVVTVADAWELYRKHLVKLGKSPATIHSYRNAVETEHLLGIWADTPLADLATEVGARKVAARHEAISEKRTGAGGGTYAANGAMRTLRAIYNWSLSRGYVKPDAEGWHPTRQVTYNPEEAKGETTAMSRRDLVSWWEAYLDLDNRLRAEFQLFLLLSGARSGSIATARWENVNVADRRLHIPTPKGGKAKAYDIPLTRDMLVCLARARRAGQVRSPNHADTFIFPGDARKAMRGSNTFPGHMSIYATTEKKLPCSGHGLRHTYRNLCTWAGVEANLSAKLMNHSQKGDVHSGTYGSREGVWPDLRDAQERISSAVRCLVKQQEGGARQIAA